MIRPTALLLTFLTGFSGLVYEVTWQKYLATLLGAQSEATAAVLGLYLGGLALGYAAFGRLTRRLITSARAAGSMPRLLFAYGVVEAAIGVYGETFPWIFSLAEDVSLASPRGQPALSFAFDLALAAALIVPPTVLMGGTIPILTQALARGLDDATRVHAWVYAFNTAGAFLGSLTAAFFLLPLLGLDGVVRAMGLVNLTAGILFVGLQAKVTLDPRARPGLSVDPPVILRLGGLAAAALLAGFAMMILQTVLNRVGAVALGASHHTFAMVVAVFVLSIAIGSSLVSALDRIPPWLVVGSQWLLVALLGLLYIEIQNSTYYAHVIRSLFRDVPQGFYAYHAAVFICLLAVLMLPIGISGALLPLLFHHLRREFGDLGEVAGKLYAWNTVGSLLGAVLGGYVLFFWLDLQEIFQVALAALVIGAALLTHLVARARGWAAALIAAAAVAGVIHLPAWDDSRLAIGRFRIREPEPGTFAGARAYFASRPSNLVVPFYDDDPIATVAVVEARPASGVGSRSIFVNGKSDASVPGDYPTMCLAAALSGLLTDDPARAFVVGWGSGVTVGELGSLDKIRRIDVAEISPAVMEAAPYFDSGNQEASLDPRVRVLRTDAYRALRRSRETYGAIISEPSNPWVTGIEMLYSEEFLRAARSRLTPRGVYLQWIHLSELDPATIDVVAHTYASVFESVAVWFTTGADLLLIGFNDPAAYPSVEILEERFAASDLRASFRRCGAASWLGLLAHEVLPAGALNAADFQGEVHTLRHPVLSHFAGRAFFAGRTVALPRLASSAIRRRAAPTLLQRSMDVSSFGDDDYRDISSQVCELEGEIECVSWIARWARFVPVSDQREQLLARLRARSGWTSVLTPDLMAALAAMHGAEAPTSLPASSSLQQAENVTRLYATFFLHSAPFDERVLDRVWSRCSASGELLACMERRRHAIQELASFRS